jgi:hypothetical protein
MGANVTIKNMRGRKIISDEEKEIDRQAALRLSSLWSKYKAENPSISQEMVAAELQMTQGAFWQYKEGKVLFGMEATVKFANFFNVQVSEIKRFDALENLLSAQQQRRIDKNIKAVMDIMNSVDADSRGIIRGKIEAWIEFMRGPDKIPEHQLKERSNFDRRSGTR